MTDAERPVCGCYAAGAELPELMPAGRWDSPTMPARYNEAKAAASDAVTPSTNVRSALIGCFLEID